MERENTNSASAFPEPSKAFIELRNYIMERAGFDLRPDISYHVWIWGKRSKVFGEAGRRDYACHDPGYCAERLRRLRDAIAEGDAVTAEVRVEDDCGDLRYARAFDEEFDGDRYSRLHVTVRSPEGLFKDEIIV